MGLNVSPCLMDSYKRRYNSAPLALRASVASSTLVFGSWPATILANNSSRRLFGKSNQCFIARQQWPHARQRTPTKSQTLDLLFCPSNCGVVTVEVKKELGLSDTNSIRTRCPSSVLSSSGTPSLRTRDKVSQNDCRSNRSGPMSTIDLIEMPSLRKNSWSGSISFRRSLGRSNHSRPHQVQGYRPHLFIVVLQTVSDGFFELFDNRRGARSTSVPAKRPRMTRWCSHCR